MNRRRGDDVLPTAVRVWTMRAAPGHGGDGNAEAPAWDGPLAHRRPVRRYPTEALVFDTETRDETGQGLLVGVWRFYRTHPDADLDALTCVEEGLFYPDELPDADPAGWDRLQRYTASASADVAPGFDPRLQVQPLSWWLEGRLFRYGDQHRDRCALVGFNLPFDLGALARHWAPARGRHHGGWSLGLWGEVDASGQWLDRRYHRRLLARAIDPRRTLFGWGTSTDPDQPQLHGQQRFVDLRTLVFGLTDRSHTLESACAAFGDPYQKPQVRYGVIDEAMLRYAREDVQHTALLYANCLAELRRHIGVDLAPHPLYSPAGVGAAYLRVMNLTPPLEKFADLDPAVLGWSMSAFYGGRAEARIVRTPVPVVVADFTSNYPAQNALLDTWPLLTAARLTVEDVTETVRALLAAPDLVGRLFDPVTWRERIGVTLVQLDHPDGVILPVRAGYQPDGHDYGIGVNPLRYDGQPWYALPDVLAAALLGTAEIKLSRAVRLYPVGRQPGLRLVQLRGQRSVDPGQTNPFVAMIEERYRVRGDPTLPTEDRARLDLFLKITANATAYGSPARFDRRELPAPVPVTVHGPGEQPVADRTCYRRIPARTASRRSPRRPPPALG